MTHLDDGGHERGSGETQPVDPEGHSLPVSLTDELRAFLDANSGDGSLFTTPDEFVRSLIRDEKARLDAERLRFAIREGYADVREGRTVEFEGDLHTLLDVHTAHSFISRLRRP